MWSRRRFLEIASGLPLVGSAFGASLCAETFANSPLPADVSAGALAEVEALAKAGDFFAELGVRPFINAAGTDTAMTSSLMPPEVMAAINYASEIQDPIDSRNTALTVQLKDRALSVAGTAEKSFEAGGVTYSHIMDPRTGTPVQGVLSVAVLTSSGTAGDALDNAFFVLGPDGSQGYLNRLPSTEAYFFLPAARRSWTMVRSTSR